MKYNIDKIYNAGKTIVAGIVLGTMISGCGPTKRVGFDGINYQTVNKNAYATVEDLGKHQASLINADQKAKQELGYNAPQTQVFEKSEQIRKLEDGLVKAQLVGGAITKAGVVGAIVYGIHKAAKGGHDGDNGTNGIDGKDGIDGVCKPTISGEAARAGSFGGVTAGVPSVTNFFK